MKRRPAPVKPKPSKPSMLNSLTIAIVAGVFILGIGIGVAFSTSTNVSSGNVASREAIDAAAPNAELCVQYGASAIVTETRTFVTLNPFTVYTSQPIMLPGCVMRQNTWSVLEQRRAISGEQVRECKQKLNTFGFTGNLDSTPRIDCIYQTDSDKNRFLNQPGAGAPPPEADGQF